MQKSPELLKERGFKNLLCIFYFNKEIFLERIKNNKFDNFTASYYLTIRKKAKEGYKSISDVSSDLFLDYINNESLCYKQEYLNNENYNNNNDDNNDINYKNEYNSRVDSRISHPDGIIYFEAMDKLSCQNSLRGQILNSY